MSYFQPDPLFPQLSGTHGDAGESNAPMGGFGYAFPGVPVQQYRSSLRSYPFMTPLPLDMRYGVRTTGAGAKRGVSYTVGFRGMGGLGSAGDTLTGLFAGGIGGWLIGAAVGFAAGYLVCKHFADVIEGEHAGPTRGRKKLGKYEGEVKVSGSRSLSSGSDSSAKRLGSGSRSEPIDVEFESPDAMFALPPPPQDELEAALAQL